MYPIMSTFTIFTASDVKQQQQQQQQQLTTTTAVQKDYFQVTDELSRENSHFSLSEALLTVVEQVLFQMWIVSCV